MHLKVSKFKNTEKDKFPFPCLLKTNLFALMGANQTSTGPLQNTE